MRQMLRLNDVADLRLVELCERIAATYTQDPSAVSGSVFAYLAKRLLAAEITPGGPYKDEHGRLSPTLNASIGRLFLLMGHPLPNVDAYMVNAGGKTLRADQQAKRALRHQSYKRAHKALAMLDGPVKSQALAFLARVEQADSTGEIAAIAQFTSDSLSIHIPSSKQSALGEANVHAWIAYTIYDHIIDGEADSSLLPAANICMRQALTIYQHILPVRHPLQELITHYFNQVDATSAWEIASCRATVANGTLSVDALPDYGNYETLAWRSCIHALGPIIVASIGSPEATQATIEHITIGLHHYLIARQLSDDIHDWREDIAGGRITPVVAILFARQQLQPHVAYPLDELIATLQADFLAEGASIISKLILKHTKLATESLLLAGSDPTSSLMGLVSRIKHMATAITDQQSHFLAFQSNYGK